MRHEPMSAFTAGNFASSDKLKALFGPEGVGSGAGTGATNRQPGSSPDPSFKPSLG